MKFSNTGPALPSLWPAAHRAAADILCIAHRGGASGDEDYRPENLRRLAQLGVHLVEIDLRTTKDGRLVVHHDPSIQIGDELRPIAAHTLAEWRGLIPAAETVLTAIRAAGLGAYLDIKDVTGAAAEWLVHFLTAERMTTMAILASVDPATVREFAQLSDAIPRAVLFRELDADPVRLARLAQAHHVHPCWEAEKRPDLLLSDTWLTAVRAEGLGVICWHEERPDVISALGALGVDGICTDAPELLTSLLH